jgi:lipoprotein-releasing system permease protein
MNSSIFIAKRLFTAKENNNNYTRPIIRIAILAIAISVAVMILSVFILSGFKDNISSKVIGFGSHIKITKFNNNQSFENDPIDFNVKIYDEIKSLDFVSHINKYATKAGIIKNDDEIHGVVLKGVSDDYNWGFFKNNLISGEVPNIKDSTKNITDDILISESISKKLNIKLGEELVIYFIQNPARVRKFTVSGIYKTALSEFDDITVFADLKHLIKLNNWNNNQIGGYEIKTLDFENVSSYTLEIDELIDFDLKAQSSKELNPQIFDWLRLQDFNVIIILILMLLVGCVNMVTSLLIIILEKSKFIGVLKAIGLSNWNIRKIFIYNSIYILLNGLFWANLVVILFTFFQKRFHLISLDETIYFMNSVPVKFDIFSMFIINLGTIIICYIVLIIPTVLIAKISPAKSIRFE